MMIVETSCSLCNEPLGAKYKLMESRIDFRTPSVVGQEIDYSRLPPEHIALCPLCTNEFKQWLLKKRMVKIGAAELQYKPLSVGPGDCACVYEQLYDPKRKEKKDD